jgi:flavorubredoxin
MLSSHVNRTTAFMQTRIEEIAPDLYRISTYIPDFNLQFNQFLVKDEQPLLWETGMRSLYPSVRDAVSKVIDPAALRWVGFSHYEPDECGSLNEWLAAAPQAQGFCSEIGAIVFANDAALRPARGVGRNDMIETGKYRFTLYPTPHLPHGWDAGVLFEETGRTLLCSDLFGHNGDVEPITRSDIVGRFNDSLKAYQATPPFMDYMPWTTRTAGQLRDLAALRPRLCATMHGSTFAGDGAKALLDLGQAMEAVLTLK